MTPVFPAQHTSSNSASTGAEGIRRSAWTPEEQAAAAARILIIGCGTHYASDDAVGLEVVRRLTLHPHARCEYRLLTHPGVELIDVFRERHRAIVFIDAVLSGAPAGTIHVTPLPAEDIESRSLGNLSAHRWSIAESLRLAGALSIEVPPLGLLGIEIQQAQPGTATNHLVEEAEQFVIFHFDELLGALFTPDGALRPTRLTIDPLDALQSDTRGFWDRARRR